MIRPDDYLVLYIWGPEMVATAGSEASEAHRAHPSVIKVEGGPSYFAMLRDAGLASSDPFSRRVGETIRDAFDLS